MIYFLMFIGACWLLNRWANKLPPSEIKIDNDFSILDSSYGPSAVNQFERVHVIDEIEVKKYD
jgi:hypothetical protein